MLNVLPAAPAAFAAARSLTKASRVLSESGLHLVAMNLPMGDLVALVGTPSRAYLARNR